MKTLDPVAPILAAVDRYIKKYDMTETGFGRKVAKNSSLLKRVRDGNATVRSLRQIVDYMDNHRG